MPLRLKEQSAVWKILSLRQKILSAVLIYLSAVCSQREEADRFCSVAGVLVGHRFEQERHLIIAVW